MSQLPNKVEKTQNSENQFSKEVAEILEILDVIENHTAELRKKILGEVSGDKSNIHLKLNKIEE